MKRIALVLALSAITLSAFGQGALIFNNSANASSGMAAAPISDNTGTLLSGVEYYACLLGGPAGSTAWTPAAMGTLSLTTNVSRGDGVVSFRTGGNVGYVNVGAYGGRTMPGVAFSDNATAQVMAWSASLGNDPVAAYNAWKADTTGTKLLGLSNPLTLKTSTSGTDPAVPRLVGLNAFSLAPVPEPSTIALGALGLLGALMIRRRK